MSSYPNDQQKLLTSAIEDRHFPGLYQSADHASLSAQRRYLCLQRFNIGCLILGSIGAAFTNTLPAGAVTWIYVVLAIILAIGIVLNLASRVRRYDKVWFDCRAVAETTKTATWRFMMKAPPFNDDNDAEQAFLDRLRKIRKARPSIPSFLAESRDPSAQALTKFMNDARRKSVQERLNLYLESRIRDQTRWYSRKAKFNSLKEQWWFWAVLVLQTLAVTFAIVRASLSGLPVSVVPPLMTCAAAAMAWSQMKRYSELAQSYSLAAQELGEQETIASKVTEEDVLLRLVEQVEETISREHTMWCARREGQLIKDR